MISRALTIVAADDQPTRRPLELVQAYTSLMGGDPWGVELLVREAGRWSSRVDGEDASSEGGVIHTLNVFKFIEDFVGTTQVFEREYERAVESGVPLLIATLALAYSDTLLRLGRPGRRSSWCSGRSPRAGSHPLRGRTSRSRRS